MSFLKKSPRALALESLEERTALSVTPLSHSLGGVAAQAAPPNQAMQILTQLAAGKQQASLENFKILQGTQSKLNAEVQAVTSGKPSPALLAGMQANASFQRQSFDAFNGMLATQQALNDQVMSTLGSAPKMTTAPGATTAGPVNAIGNTLNNVVANFAAVAMPGKQPASIGEGVLSAVKSNGSALASKATGGGAAAPTAPAAQPVNGAKVANAVNGIGGAVKDAAGALASKTPTTAAKTGGVGAGGGATAAPPGKVGGVGGTLAAPVNPFFSTPEANKPLTTLEKNILGSAGHANAQTVGDAYKLGKTSTGGAVGSALGGAANAALTPPGGVGGAVGGNVNDIVTYGGGGFAPGNQATPAPRNPTDFAVATGRTPAEEQLFKEASGRSDASVAVAKAVYAPPAQSQTFKEATGRTKTDTAIRNAATGTKTFFS